MHFEHPKQLLDHEGAELGTSDWMLIDQARINGFADDTDDRQWLHVDAERAKSGPSGPYGPPGPPRAHVTTAAD